MTNETPKPPKRTEQNREQDLKRNKTGRTGKSFTYYAGTVLMFVIFLALLDRGFFYVFTRWEKSFYKKNHLQRIFYQRRDFNKGFLSLPPGTYDTLILGSSRTHRGIHPFYIHRQLGHNAFKIAKGKISIKFNYYFYQEFKKYAGTPKVVIYGLDYFMFNRETHPFFMNSITGIDMKIEPYNSGPLLTISNKKRFDSLLNDALEQISLTPPAPVQHSPQTQVIDPFIGYTKPAKDQLVRKKSSASKSFEYTPYPGIEGIFFTRLLDRLYRDEVQVVLVSLPDYIGTYESNYRYDEFIKNIRDLTTKYPNVTLYDYNRPKKFDLNNPAYFLDGGYGKTNSHLSKEGSRILHQKLLPQLQSHYNNYNNNNYNKL